MIDDQGRLFGLVNVIDALVVLFVIAVVVAGIAFVNPFATRDTATRYATIELGAQPDYLVERVDPGDVMNFDDSRDNLTITDVYLGPARNGTQITVRVRLTGKRVENPSGPTRFLAGGEPILVGQSLTIETIDYTVEGQVTRVDVDGEQLPSGTTAVVASTNLSSAEAERLTVGDAYRVDGQSVAVLRTIQRYPTTDGTGQLAILGLELSTIQRGTTTQFGPHEIRLGATIPFSTPSYDLSGEVVRTGTTEPSGEPTTTSATVKIENVPPELADDIRVGLTETVRGETLVRVVDRNATPAVVILESEDGNIYERQHPRNLDLTLTVELQTRETMTDLRFHGDPIHIGDTVVLDFGSLTVEAEVTSLD